jgi:hypothetical protein
MAWLPVSVNQTFPSAPAAMLLATAPDGMA